MAPGLRLADAPGCAVQLAGCKVSKFIERERAHLKGRWVYLLVLITCCWIAVQLAEQGQTIDTQRSLIRLLWGDSRELNALKIHELQNQKDHSKAAPDDAHKAAPESKPESKRPAAPKPRARKPHPQPQPEPEQRQAIERPGPRVLRYI